MNEDKLSIIAVSELCDKKVKRTSWDIKEDGLIKIGFTDGTYLIFKQEGAAIGNVNEGSRQIDSET